MMHSRGALFVIAAFTSERTNLSPFTKGCRERDALMRLIYNFWNLLHPCSKRQVRCKSARLSR